MMPPVMRSAKSTASARMADDGKSPRRSWHQEAFLAIKTWSKRLHQRPGNRLKDASLSSSTSMVSYDAADDRSQASEAASDSLSGECSECDVTSKQQLKGIIARSGSRVFRRPLSIDHQSVVLCFGPDLHAALLHSKQTGYQNFRYICFSHADIFSRHGCECRKAQLACVAAQSATCD